MAWYNRPLFGQHGQKVIAVLCAYEVVALHPAVPLPTLSDLVDKHPVLGWCFLAALGHHWFVEDPTKVLVVLPAGFDPDHPPVLVVAA